MKRTSEQLLKWEPFPGLPRNLDTPSLTTDYQNGFHLILAEPRVSGRAFRVEFTQPLAFRSVNESYRLKLIEPINSQLPWPTFKVEHSTLGRVVSRPVAWNLPRLGRRAFLIHGGACH
jgi:hypothetical protein